MFNHDIIAAQAVRQARLIEAAVNDPGPWTVICGDQTASARRFLTDAGVTFLADFPQGMSTDTVVLACRGEVLSVRDVAPQDEFATLRWDVVMRMVDATL